MGPTRGSCRGDCVVSEGAISKQFSAIAQPLVRADAHHFEVVHPTILFGRTWWQAKAGVVSCSRTRSC